MRAKPLSEATQDLSQIRGVCFDIDDTFSTEGKISSAAYSALWDLHDAGFILVPITGRPAGWCDHIARFWPVDAVVGENGAFSLWMEQGKLRRKETQLKASGEERTLRLSNLKKKILSRFPEAKFASDQNYREFDLAIDFCEDVTPWDESQIQSLVKLCESEGAIAKVSSIHVNTWFGNYDKKTGFGALLDEVNVRLDWHDSLFAPKPHPAWIFIGDSPNDEPLFEGFENSVGVANLNRFLNHLKFPPRWVTRGQSGHGFCELAQALLISR